jgi:hypothetical protein
MGFWNRNQPKNGGQFLHVLFHPEQSLAGDLTVLLANPLKPCLPLA